LGFAKVPNRSRYDELHDKYDSILTTKQGTRYERLAAIVFKILEDNNVVIHDVQLRGASDVPHQIDVHIERDGRSRHLIIECKDFDISDNKVGLDIVRNFWAVAADTTVDEALILACTGFTADAAKFAKAKGIKLAVLRIFEDADWEGRFRTIDVNIIALTRKNWSMSINVASEEARRDLAIATRSFNREDVLTYVDPVFMVKGEYREPLTTFIDDCSRDKERNERLPSASDKVTLRIRSDGWRLEINNHSPISFNSIDVSYEMGRIKSRISVTSKRVAELLVSGLGEADIVIFDDQLERHKIDAATGEVV
jgi:hypothetical protein